MSNTHSADAAKSAVRRLQAAAAAADRGDWRQAATDAQAASAAFKVAERWQHSIIDEKAPLDKP